MLSSSENIAIELLQLVPTLSNNIPPLSDFIYPHIFPIPLRVVENNILHIGRFINNLHAFILIRSLHE